MYCFRFSDEATFLTLATAEGLVQDDRLITGGHGWAIDPIGTIYEGGTYDEQGEVIDPPVALDGYHVNTKGPAPEAWAEFLIVVNSPVRVFLGAQPNRRPLTS